MSAEMMVRRLRPDDAASLVSLRLEALKADPLSFGASPEEDRCRSLEFVQNALADTEEQAAFGYFDGEQLAGMVGVIRASLAKRRHRAQVWGMYVAPRARRKGVGRALLRAVIQHARAWPDVETLQLSVTEHAAVARSMYESEGFRAWGREPRALMWQGRFVDESHLILDLHEPGMAAPERLHEPGMAAPERGPK